MGNYYNLDTIKPHPAPKEQRDLLFQKMKEAGYEWDAEKKELRKIENPTAWSEDMVLAGDRGDNVARIVRELKEKYKNIKIKKKLL